MAPIDRNDSGASFTDYCREHTFAPLGMTRSTWKLAGVAPEEFAFSYVPDPSADGKLLRITPVTWPGYMDRQVLQVETVATMLAPQKVKIPPTQREFPLTVDHALVWPLNRLGDEILHFHDAFGGGCGTLVFFHPVKKSAGMIFVTPSYLAAPR